MRIELFIDYRSPYAYLANLDAKTWGTRIDYKPIDVMDVMAKINNTPTFSCAPKLQYAGMDVTRWAHKHGIAFSPNQLLLQALGAGTFDGTLLTCAGLAAQELGVFDRVNDALFNAVWTADDDLLTEEGRAAFLKTRNIDAVDLWELASDAKTVMLCKARSQEAVDRGVFGVPTTFVNDEMFFGNDRVDFVRAAISRALTARASK
jgi:2-hydroxychromene-2-carboxylate isomerase